jgi:hypothetical protein
MTLKGAFPPFTVKRSSHYGSISRFQGYGYTSLTYKTGFFLDLSAIALCLFYTSVTYKTGFFLQISDL